VADHTPREGGTLVFAAEEQVQTLDPTFAYDEVSGYANHSMFDTLLDHTADLELVPRLAERWEVDGARYTFWLRPNLRYADGTPITAADFKYSLERAKREGPFSGYVSDVVQIATPSDRELVIELAHPQVAFVHVLAMTFTTPQRAGGTQLRSHPLASGPYKLAEWREGERLVLERNPYYFDPHRSHLDRIELRERIPRSTQFLMFERGELDAVEHLASPDYVWIAEQPAWQPYIHRQILLNAYGSRFDTRVAPFDDVRVRQAFNYALDKSHTRKLMNNNAVSSHGMLPPGSFGRDETLAPYPHDVAKARALLAAAGYPDGLTVEYATTPDDEAQRLAASLQSDLAEAGVRVQIVTLSWSAYTSGIGNPGFPAFSLASWTADYPDPTSIFDPVFHSRSITDRDSVNNTFYRNAELDRLLDLARGEPDRTRRAELYQRVERILFDDAPWLWDYHRPMVEVTQPRVGGYEPHPIWLRDYTSAWIAGDRG